MIIQTSKDGNTWINDIMVTNVFEDVPNQSDPFYTANSVQLSNGCYYRLIIAYKTGRKIGENKTLFITTDEYEYKKTVEVYEFYLHDNSDISGIDSTLSRNLGELSKAEDSKGYAGNEEKGIKDPHYGWEIGQFFCEWLYQRNKGR